MRAQTSIDHDCVGCVGRRGGGAKLALGVVRVISHGFPLPPLPSGHAYSSCCEADVMLLFRCLLVACARDLMQCYASDRAHVSCDEQRLPETWRLVDVASLASRVRVGRAWQSFDGGSAGGGDIPPSLVTL